MMLDHWIKLFYTNPTPPDVNLKAAGYDWIGYAQNMKMALMAVVFEFYKLDKNIHSLEKGVERLDIHYRAVHEKSQGRPDPDEDAFFSTPCLLAMGDIISGKESDWGIKSLMGNVKAES
jgi:hypothetical protein